MLRRRPIARMAVGTAVVAGTAGAVARRSAGSQQAAAAAAAPVPAAAPAAADPYEQLKQLGELHEQGILTDEEFAAQKAKLLA
jgi:membrane protease subunit (stomatin/prohibitin family)